jgi:hypothetical protein
MDDLVRWNNNVISAKSCAFTLAGVPYVGIVALDYADKLDAELVHGNNKDGSPIGYTSGEYSVDGFTFQVLKDVWIAKMLPQLAALSAAMLAPGSYGGARFPWIAQYQEGPLVGVDTLTGARVVGTKDTYAQGTGKLVVEVTCMAMTLMRNGLTLYDRTRIP